MAKGLIRIKASLAWLSELGTPFRPSVGCPTRKRGGDLGEFRKEHIVKPFDQVVFTKALYKVHDPVKTQFGYHLIKILYRT